MENAKRKITYTVAGLSLLTTLFCGSIFASSIDPENKYAWSENTGWLNFADSNAQVRVFNDHLEGYVWSENVGWIRLGVYSNGGTHSYANSSASNWGVNNDGVGNLSGYAWSENTGWINFNSANGGPVTVDSSTGAFAGYAWSENVGWIHFQNATPAYRVNLQDADLSVSKTAGTNPVTPGDDLTYTITVTNNGPGIADNIQLEDTLPAGLNYASVDVGATGWSCTHNTGTVTCTLNTLPAGSDASVLLTVSTDATLEESLTNTAVASLYGPDSDSANNSGSDTTYFGLGDISCSGYDATVSGDFSAGMHLCVGRNALVTSGDVNISADAIVYFQSPQTTLDKGFKVNPQATFTSSTVVGNVAPYIAGPDTLSGIVGETLDFTLTHSCEDYEDGVLAISPTDSGVLSGPAGTEVFTIDCTDTNGKTGSKSVTITKE